MSTTKKPATKKPAAAKAAASKTAAPKAAVGKPATAKAPAKKSATKKPAVKKPVGPIQVEAIDAQPEFDLFTYCELSGETRIEHDLLEELEPRFDGWAEKYLRAYKITDPAAPGDGGHVVIWLEEPVEEEIEGVWQDSQSAGMAFHNLAIHMVMSAAQNLVPELADKGCAPLPKPTSGILKAFEKLGLIWNKEGTVNRQFAVFTRMPYSAGCSICILRAKCPNANDD
ncbi:MAG: hypothetical protein AB9900_07555 [Humidesulfovibrio sp.]